MAPRNTSLAPMPGPAGRSGSELDPRDRERMRALLPAIEPDRRIDD
ncbi:MAG: hypothetical protein BroJett022_19490 [Actinomycetes bacterium]|nr:MAG: hypothetical protein BroJett022_19490 [Actinomycetes bacterium]